MLAIWLVVAVMLGFVWYLSRPAGKGKVGEWIVALSLKIGLDHKKYRILNNVMIPDNAQGTTQIDHIVLSCYGIFVIETKNIRGWIFGDSNSEKWMQQIFKSKHQFQNPFRQNYKHIKCLAELTGVAAEKFHHIIVFVGDCEIKTRDKLPPSLITGGQGLLNYINSFQELQFSDAELNEIEKIILTGRVSNTFSHQKAHVAHVQEIIQTKTSNSTLTPAPAVPTASTSPTPSSSAPAPEAQPHCPKCGGPMVRRQAKTGANAGKYFWGCAHYPKCRGIVNE